MNSIVMQSPKTVEIIGGVEYISTNIEISLTVKSNESGSTSWISLSQTLGVEPTNIRSIQWVKATASEYLELGSSSWVQYSLGFVSGSVGRLETLINRKTFSGTLTDVQFNIFLKVEYIKGTAPTGLGDYGTFNAPNGTTITISDFAKAGNFYKYFTIA